MIARRVGVVFSVLCLIAIYSGAIAAAKQADFKDRFTGRWEADKDKTKKYSSEHDDIVKLPDEFLESMPKFRFEFLESGVATAAMDKPPDGESKSMEGDWKLVEEIDENHAKVRIMMKVDGKEDAKEAAVEFVDDDTIAITIEEQPTLVFVRSIDESEKNAESSSDKKDK
jgi:hypothetical protein